jgi:peptidoglycan-N-acetylglucosamine deacetylase
MSMAYLTVDDGPSPLFSEKLEFLRERAVPAAFFCIGGEIAGKEDSLARAIDLGFELGNHAWSHRRFSELRLEDCVGEIERTDAALCGVYRLAGRPWARKLFRFPFFDIGKPELGEAIQAALRALGYEPPEAQAAGTARWSPGPGRVDTLCGFDQMEYWVGKPEAPRGLDRPGAVLARIGVEGPSDGDIILIHDHQRTHSLFFECVEGYLRHGFELAALR